MKSVYDGFISRNLNRRISRPMARALAHTPVTPNQVSFASLAIAVGSLVCFLYGQYIPAALLAQASSIVDGVDGDLARLKNMTSRFGGYMDSVLDRYADAPIFIGVTYWAAEGDGGAHIWITGSLALAGVFIVTYTRARIEDLPRNLFDRGVTSLASRDIRLFIVMVGVLTGYGFATLIALAALHHGVILLRLLRIRRVLFNSSPHP